MEGGTEGKEGGTEDLGSSSSSSSSCSRSSRSSSSSSSSSSNRSNSSNDSSMAWPGVVAPNSSGNRGGVGLVTVAVVEEISDDRAEGAVVDVPGGGAVAQSLSTPPARWLRIPTIVPVTPSTAPRQCASNSP